MRRIVIDCDSCGKELELDSMGAPLDSGGGWREISIVPIGMPRVMPSSSLFPTPAILAASSVTACSDACAIDALNKALHEARTLEKRIQEQDRLANAPQTVSASIIGPSGNEMKAEVTVTKDGKVTYRICDE